MRLKRFFSFSGSWRKGQSLVELTLVLTLLLTLLTGMVEFANLLNEYITLTDAAREGARFGSNDDPFIRPAMTRNILFYLNIDQIVEGTFTYPPTNMIRNPASKGALSPIVLRPEIGDDVVISVFSISDGTLKRFPEGTGDNGWSYYHNKYPSSSHYRTSAFTTSQLQNRAIATAPNTGFVLVEIYYSYDQLIKLWAFIGAPDPIPVHTYAIMPLSAAEPTPIP